MADLPMLADRLLNRPHMVLPSYANQVAAALAHRLNAQPVLGTNAPITSRPARSPTITKGGVLILPIVGGLMHRGDGLDAQCGAQSYTNLQNMLVMGLANPDVKGILLDIDSPGGQASGCFEFADVVRDASAKKPIWSIANALAASAAYAIGCSADRFYVTPSGEVGSIGVCFMHVDYSKMVERAGMAITYVYAGKHKIDGNPYEPLPAAVKQEMQVAIDEMYQGFVSLVADRRAMEAKEVRRTEARCFLAEDARKLRLVDEVASFDVALDALTQHVNKAPVYRVNSTGASKMSKNEPQVEGLSEALARARADGEAAMEARMQPKLAEAYVAGRKDAAAIFASDAAQGRGKAAAVFAANPKFSADEAIALLGVTAKEDEREGDARAKASLKNDAAGVTADKADDRPGDGDDYQKMVAGYLTQYLPAQKAS
jgi:signal peptide peptidase SppA